jgi:2-methylcitrate dehydratase PrpD
MISTALPATTPYTRPLAEFALGIEAEQVPAEIKHETSRIVMDCLGCAVAGLVTPAGRIAVELVQGEHGPLMATAVSAGPVSLMRAAFANTMLTNALDFDVWGPEGHMAPAVVPAAVGVAEAIDASGAELMAGLVAGLEVGGRIGGALRRFGMQGARQMGAVRGQGHVAIAVAAAAGRLLRLTSDEMHHAFGIAGYSATVPTLRKFFASANPPMTKYDFLGVMAQSGIQAALLAQRGFTGDLEVLEGDLGFWRFNGAPGCDWEHLTRDLGSYWTIAEVSYKHYPTNLSFSNPSIVLVRRLAQEHHVRVADIERIQVRWPRAAEEAPATEIRHAMDAWTTPGYTIAAGLLDVHPRRAWLEPEVYRREDLLELMRRVSVGPIRDGEVTTTGSYWERWEPVRATIIAGGRSIEGGSDYLPTMDDAQLVAKFHENVGGFLTETDAEALAQACWNLETLGSACEVANHLHINGQRP